MILSNERINYYNEDPKSVRIFTTNSFVKKDRSLVMGRGNAKEISSIYPELPKKLGKVIDHLGEYYYLEYEIEQGKFAAFQVKYHWFDEADLGLIQKSTDLLKYQARLNICCLTYHLPFPGIGNGKLSREDVLPILEELPSNVVVHELRT